MATTVPVSTPLVVYVTVTVTPEPTDMADTTVNDLANLNDTPTTTALPLQSPTTTKSPGFASILALSCLAGVAMMMLRRGKR